MRWSDDIFGLPRVFFPKQAHFVRSRSSLFRTFINGSQKGKTLLGPMHSDKNKQETRSLLVSFIHLFFHTHLLSSSWTSRGHRRRPFSPPAFAFNFRRALGSAIRLLVEFSSSVAIIFISFFTRIYFPASGLAVVTGVVPSTPRFLSSIFYRA